MNDDEKVRKKLQGMAANIEKELPDDFGFILLVFPFGGESGRPMLYVAKAEREDALTSMQEFIDQNKAQHQFGRDQFFEEQHPPTI